MTEGFNEIIAIRIGSKILFGQLAIDELKQHKTYDQLISRAEFKMLAKLDLGDKWGQYAEHAPTLLMLDDKTPFDIRKPRNHWK